MPIFYLFKKNYYICNSMRKVRIGDKICWGIPIEQSTIIYTIVDIDVNRDAQIKFQWIDLNGIIKESWCYDYEAFNQNLNKDDYYMVGYCIEPIKVLEPCKFIG